MKQRQDALGPKEQKYIKDIIYDLKEQVLLALSKDEFYKRWGSHYFYSIQRAHILQQRNNFKDPGVQHYGGEIFQSLQEKIEELFITIPPPKPSLKNQQALFSNASTGSKGGSKPVPQAAPKSMRVFHNAQSGCFSGDSQVLMADGTTKLVKEVKKGELIASDENSVSRVICVVKTHIKSGRAIMCKLPGGIKITPWHPIRVDGKWFFPEQLVPGEEVDCDDFFDFVLDQGHIAMINGIECVTLGHGFKGEVVEHAFLGTLAVVKDLESKRGFGDGVVELAQDCFRRDPETTLIVGLNSIDE